MTEGQRLVAALVARFGAAEIARRVKTSESMARHLGTGRKTPGDALKARLADACSVPPGSWSEPARAVEEKPKPPPAIAPSSKKAIARDTALHELWATVDLIDDAIDTLDNGAPATHRASLLGKRTDALDKIAKLQGEGELTASTMTKSKIWLDLLAKLRPVLEKHPECASEIATVLESLEAA